MTQTVVSSKQTLLTIVYVVCTEDGISQKFENILNDYKQDPIEILIYDSICSEITSRAISNFEKKFIGFCNSYNEKNLNIDEIYKRAIKKATGCYIIFTNNQVIYKGNILHHINTLISNKKQKYYVLKTYRIEDNKKIIYKNDKKIPNLNLFCYIFKKDIATKIALNISKDVINNIEFILRFMINTKIYKESSIEIETETFFEYDSYNYSPMYSSEWYINSLLNVYLPIIRKFGTLPYIQHTVLYAIQLRFAANRNNRNKNILTDNEIRNFYDICKEILLYIDDKVLLDSYYLNGKILPLHMSYYLWRLKYENKKKKIRLDKSKDSIKLYCNDILFEKSQNIKFCIIAINRNFKDLIIDYKITNVYYLNKKFIKIIAQIEKKEIPTITNEIYSLDKYFGESFNKEFTGTCQLSRKIFSNGARVFFYLKYAGCKIKLPIVFTQNSSRLTNGLKTQWVTGSYSLSHDAKNKCINITKKRLFTRLRNEINLLCSLLSLLRKRKMKFIIFLNILLLRFAYFCTTPFIKKEIWITYDQLFKGGDNGEALFRYVQDEHISNIRLYYIINKDCHDAIKLKQNYKYILDFNAFRTRLLVLHSKFIFATRVGALQYCGFSNTLEKYFRDIFHYHCLCLQHGLSIQKIAEYQNRLFDNTRYYFCVSPVEVQNLLHPAYNYDRTRLLLTGAPRYDRLYTHNVKRQILIAPTWRRNVTKGTNKKGHPHEYSTNFKNTEYFNIYNSLINDSRLIEFSQKYNYKIIYLIHPNMSSQRKDFDENPIVEIMEGSSNEINYNTLLSESALLITDYSGIQYDFAWLKKPVIYYHPETLPPQYNPSFDYITVGFGPVISHHNYLIDTLCDYMMNNCKLHDIYAQRINKFFNYSDSSNCQCVISAMDYIRSTETQLDSNKSRLYQCALSGISVKTADKGIQTSLLDHKFHLLCDDEPLSIYKISPDGVTLRWMNYLKAEQIKLYRKKTSQDSYSLCGAFPNKTIEFTDSQLSEESVSYKLVWETESATLEAETELPALQRVDIPFKLEYSAENGVLQLDWDWKQDPVTYRVVQLTNADPEGKLLATQPASQNFLPIPRLKSSVTGFRVENVIPCGKANYYSGLSPIILSPFRAEITIDGIITFTWQHIVGVTLYELYKFNDEHDEFVNIGVFSDYNSFSKYNTYVYHQNEDCSSTKIFRLTGYPRRDTKPVFTIDLLIE